MTAAEKRYFKIHYSSDKNLTTDLFDFINNMQMYDEDIIKKHFIKTKLSKNLKVYKVQLTELLLKSLTSHHNKKSIGSKIRMGLEEIEILMNKQLYNLAQNKVKKVKGLCLKYEEYIYIFPILFFEIRLEFSFSISPDKKKEIFPEIDNYSNTLNNIYRLQRSNYKLTDIANNQLTHKLDAAEVEFYKNFLEKEEPNSDSNQLSFQEKQWINSSISVIYHILYNDAEKEFHYKKKNIKLFEKHPHFISNHPHFYYAALFNFLSLSLRLKKFEELNPGIQQITKLTTQFPFLTKNLIFIKYLEVKYYYKSEQFEKIDEPFENALLKIVNKFNQEEEFIGAIIFIYMTLLHLIQENYKNVHFYLRRLHRSARHLDKNYAFFFEVLELICHYESNAIDSLQKALNTHLKKEKEHLIFISFCQFMNQLIQQPKKERKELAISFKKTTDNKQKDSLLNLLNEFILQNWLDAIIQGHSYSKEMKK